MCRLQFLFVFSFNVRLYAPRFHCPSLAFECRNFIIFPYPIPFVALIRNIWMHSIQRRYMANSDNILLFLYRRIKYMVHICSAQCARQAICAHIHIIFIFTSSLAYLFTSPSTGGFRNQLEMLQYFLPLFCFISISLSARCCHGSVSVSMRVICVLFWQSNSFQTVFFVSSVFFAIVRSTFVAHVKSIASRSFFSFHYCCCRFFSVFHFVCNRTKTNIYMKFKCSGMWIISQTVSNWKYGWHSGLLD